MVLKIESAEADRLARELARVTGESVTQAITVALRERLERVRPDRTDLVERLLAIGESARALPRQDQRSDDEILGYDDNGHAFV